MKHLEIVNSKVKNPSTGSFDNGLWGGIGIDGKSVVSGEIAANGHLIFTLSDNSQIDCGVVDNLFGFDDVPILGSHNLVDSGHIKLALNNKADLEDLVGKTSVKGTQYIIDGMTYTVGDNAEYFNSYSNNKAIGSYSHTEGFSTTATGYSAHAEGSATTASGVDSHAEGAGTRATGSASHAEGSGTIASGGFSHAEGAGAKAIGSTSHAEGAGAVASGNNSHAEGGGTTASGTESHAEGGGTVASGAESHAEGLYTKASSNYQHAQGKYNVEDANSTYAFIIGNGTSDNARSNAFAIDWQGNIYQNNAQFGINIATALSTKADLENGKIPISQIPPAAVERMRVVADDAARFALTTDTVQNGDTVKVTSTNKMYLVIDNSKLDSEAGYQVYVAGRAAEAVADQNGNVIDTTYATKATTKTSWVGTAAQYAALQSDDYELYFVEEEES